MTSSINILIIGELNVDLVLRDYSSFPAPGKEILVEDAILALGSASAICASGLAKLGNSVGYLSKVGDDSWGRLCLNALRDFGVDTSRVAIEPALKTGLTVSITSAKDRALVTYLGSIAALGVRDIPENAFHGFHHLHVSSFFLQQRLRPDLGSVLARARDRGLTTSLDTGFDPQGHWGISPDRNDLIDVLAQVDVFLPNEIELEGITGVIDREAALRKLQNGRTLTVAKLGSHGCATLENGDLLQMPAFHVQAVDTTGAGDSFNAGFLHAWLRKRPLPEALRFASACGALSTLRSGGTASQPNEQEALRMMNAQELVVTEAGAIE